MIHVHTGMYTVIFHKLVLKSVSYHGIEKNTPLLIQQSLACRVYIKHPVNYILLESLYSIDAIYDKINIGIQGVLKLNYGVTSKKCRF